MDIGGHYNLVYKLLEQQTGTALTRYLQGEIMEVPGPSW